MNAVNSADADLCAGLGISPSLNALGLPTNADINTSINHFTVYTQSSSAISPSGANQQSRPLHSPWSSPGSILNTSSPASSRTASVDSGGKSVFNSTTPGTTASDISRQQNDNKRLKVSDADSQHATVADLREQYPDNLPPAHLVSPFNYNNNNANNNNAQGSHTFETNYHPYIAIPTSYNNNTNPMPNNNPNNNFTNTYGNRYINNYMDSYNNGNNDPNYSSNGNLNDNNITNNNGLISVYNPYRSMFNTSQPYSDHSSYPITSNLQQQHLYSSKTNMPSYYVSNMVQSFIPDQSQIPSGASTSTCSSDGNASTQSHYSYGDNRERYTLEGISDSSQHMPQSPTLQHVAPNIQGLTFHKTEPVPTSDCSIAQPPNYTLQSLAAGVSPSLPDNTQVGSAPMNQQMTNSQLPNSRIMNQQISVTSPTSSPMPDNNFPTYYSLPEGQSFAYLHNGPADYRLTNSVVTKSPMMVSNHHTMYAPVNDGMGQHSVLRSPQPSQIYNPLSQSMIVPNNNVQYGVWSDNRNSSAFFRQLHMLPYSNDSQVPQSTQQYAIDKPDTVSINSQLAQHGLKPTEGTDIITALSVLPTISQEELDAPVGQQQGITWDAKKLRWVSYWSAGTGKRVFKSFSVKKYGYNYAKKLAIAHRRAAMRQRQLERQREIEKRLPSGTSYMQFERSHNNPSMGHPEANMQDALAGENFAGETSQPSVDASYPSDNNHSTGTGDSSSTESGLIMKDGQRIDNTPDATVRFASFSTTTSLPLPDINFNGDLSVKTNNGHLSLESQSPAVILPSL